MEQLNAAATADTSTSPGDNDFLCDSSDWGYQDIFRSNFNSAASIVAPSGPYFQTAFWELTDDEQQQVQSLDSWGQARPQPQHQPQNQKQQRSTTPRTLPAEFLTLDQRQKLGNIAIPPRLQYNSPKSESTSPLATTDGRAAAKTGRSSLDEHNLVLKMLTRKRKSSADYEDNEYGTNEYSPTKNTCHNIVEKRYRTSLNDKIAALRDSMPYPRIKSKSTKGKVLSKAVEYIHYLEERNGRLLYENYAMKTRVAVFEHPLMTGAMTGPMTTIISPIQQPPTPTQRPRDQYIDSPLVVPRGGKVAQGMI